MDFILSSFKIFTMKKYAAGLVFFACILGFSNLSAAVTEISDKVMRSFKQTFPFAEKVNWQEFADRYSVHFEERDIRTVVDYDRDGNFLGSKRYYQENNLPVNILCKIRKKYADKTIFGVTEISTEYSTEYYIKLEDAGSWTTVKSDAYGAMEVTEKYKKQY
jgi:hypothetical protein